MSVRTQKERGARVLLWQRVLYKHIALRVCWSSTSWSKPSKESCSKCKSIAKRYAKLFGLSEKDMKKAWYLEGMCPVEWATVHWPYRDQLVLLEGYPELAYIVDLDDDDKNPNTDRHPF